jgi:hypothetical protein
MILNSDQCNSEDLSDTFLSGECGIYGDICKELCSNIISSDEACNAREDDCFWLYSGSSGTEGSCKDINDESLECSSIENGDQCKTGLEKTTLGNDCFWLLENPSGSQGVCLEKVWCNILWWVIM